MTDEFEDEFKAKKLEGQDISVQIGTEFLNLFSEHLYSSPQKALEELIANGWDAGAADIDIFIPDNLHPAARLMVIDNGESMNIEGLKKLWRIAVSDKGMSENRYGRPMIGKFGIGKLATYVLANKFTYICKTEGKIKCVVMDYSRAISNNASGAPYKLVDELKLPVYEIEEGNLLSRLGEVEKGSEIAKFIRKEYDSANNGYEDEYNCDSADTPHSGRDTWTLVVLSALKEKGMQLKCGVLKNMLRAAMPLGSGIKIRMNGELLSSKKQDISVDKCWELGQEDIMKELQKELHPYQVTATPGEKSIEIKGIGKITGKVKLYKEKISSGKSESREASNGFHINVLGRVVNQADNYFKLSDLRHSTWAKFRATIRADELNRHLVTSREGFHETEQIIVFRQLLRKLFNIARSYDESNEQSIITDMEDVWANYLGPVSIWPLKNFVHRALSEDDFFGRDFVSIKDGEEPAHALNEWQQRCEQEKKVIEAIRIKDFEDSEDLVKYDVPSHSILINNKHPFVAEYATGKEEKKLLEKIISAMLLGDIYLSDIGVGDGYIQEAIEYRDRVMRVKALAERKSAFNVIDLLGKSEHDSSSEGAKRYEHAVAAAFRCLGFNVETRGGSGDTDAVVTASIVPGAWEKCPAYKFVLDAKTSQGEKVQTGNLKIEQIERHRKDEKAEFAVIVAPGYQTGADDGAEKSIHAILKDHRQFLCLTTVQLIKLLKITGEYGVIPYDVYRQGNRTGDEREEEQRKGLFDLSIGSDIDAWIESMKATQKKKAETSGLTLESFLNALKAIEQLHRKGRKIHITNIFQKLNELDKDKKDHLLPESVTALAKGIEALVPDLVQVNEDSIITIKTSIEAVAREVKQQLSIINPPDKKQEEE